MKIRKRSNSEDNEQEKLNIEINKNFHSLKFCRIYGPVILIRKGNIHILHYERILKFSRIFKNFAFNINIIHFKIFISINIYLNKLISPMLQCEWISTIFDARINIKSSIKYKNIFIYNYQLHRGI